MSSAILYLSIVVIWAFLLVPRWVRRPHAATFAGGSTGVEGELTEAKPTEAELAGAELPDEVAEAGAAQPPVIAAGLADSGGDREVPGSARSVKPARPAIGRTKIIQARRRLLTILVLLTIAAGTCTALRLTSPWICVPPSVMLGIYVLLLRETAVADAEHARGQAEHATLTRQRTLARSRSALAARVPQPSAQIIDISGRLKDQLYDQYEDATNRAVGD
ncbi:MAG: hypothetical protein ACRDNZ_03670 [Streptosporangiaceae bacterium]